MLNYRPSGSMCAVCKFKARFCGDLPFHRMRKMKTDSDGVVVVKCNDFKKVVLQE